MSDQFHIARRPFAPRPELGVSHKKLRAIGDEQQ